MKRLYIKGLIKCLIHSYEEGNFKLLYFCRYRQHLSEKFGFPDEVYIDALGQTEVFVTTYQKLIILFALFTFQEIKMAFQIKVFQKSGLVSEGSSGANSQEVSYLAYWNKDSSGIEPPKHNLCLGEEKPECETCLNKKIRDINKLMEQVKRMRSDLELAVLPGFTKFSSEIRRD